MRWRYDYWIEYQAWVHGRPVIFVAVSGTAYVAVDWAKTIRHKRLGDAPKPPKVRRKLLPTKRLPRKKPTHEAHRSVQ